MPYSLLNRIGHTSRRLQQLNPVLARDADGNQIEGTGVTLVRGSVQTPNVPAAFGMTDGQEMTPGVTMTDVRVQDFLIDTDQYKFEGEIYEPAVGDQIWVPANAYYPPQETIDGWLYFALRGTGFDESPFLYITSDRTRLRIHTVRLQ